MCIFAAFLTFKKILKSLKWAMLLLPNRDEPMDSAQDSDNGNDIDGFSSVETEAETAWITYLKLYGKCIVKLGKFGHLP